MPIFNSNDPKHQEDLNDDEICNTPEWRKGAKTDSLRFRQGVLSNRFIIAEQNRFDMWNAGAAEKEIREINQEIAERNKTLKQSSAPASTIMKP